MADLVVRDLDPEVVARLEVRARVGDSGEKDPEVYREIKKRFPDRHGSGYEEFIEFLT